MSRLLRWICDPDVLEAIEGDLFELYAGQRSWRWAVDVVSLCVRQPRTLVRSLAAAFLVLMLMGPAKTVPLHYTIHAADPAGRFVLEFDDGRAIAASLDGAPVRERDLVQTGDTLIIRGGDHGADFHIALTPGGIAWYPRRSASH